MTPPPFDQKIRRNDSSIRPHQETKVYGVYLLYFFNKNLNPPQQSRHFLKKTPATFRTRHSNYM